MEERLDSENTKTRRSERVRIGVAVTLLPVAIKVMRRVIIKRIQNGVDHVL